jgi:hypothetical protein
LSEGVLGFLAKLAFWRKKEEDPFVETKDFSALYRPVRKIFDKPWWTTKFTKNTNIPSTHPKKKKARKVAYASRKMNRIRGVG